MNKDREYWTNFNKQNEKKWKVIFDNLQKEVVDELSVSIEDGKDIDQYLDGEKTLMHISVNDKGKGWIGVDEIDTAIVFNTLPVCDRNGFWLNKQQMKALRSVIDVILENAV